MTTHEQSVILSNGVVKIRPFVPKELVERIALDCFGLVIDKNTDIKELVSYDDRNFLIQGQLQARGSEFDIQYGKFSKFVMKIFNSETTRKTWYDEINHIIVESYKKCEEHFKLALPVVDIKNNGTSIFYNVPLSENAVFENGTTPEALLESSECLTKDGTVFYGKHLIRLTVFINGCTVNVKEMNDQLGFSYGKSCAILSDVMKSFPAPVDDYRHNWVWNMIYASKQLEDPYLCKFDGEAMKVKHRKILSDFDEFVKPKLDELPKQWSHCDLNDQNLLQYQNNIVGIVDFDDACYSYRVIDISTVLMYIISMSSLDVCLHNARQVYKGYETIMQLSEIERSVLFKLMLVRFVQSIVIGTYQYNYIDIGNEYLLLTLEDGKTALNYLLELGEDEFIKKVLNAL